ncbi:hypothetical protein CAOG_02503 [Capsaspora owczarzaki ATCC 30864]|uniref:Cytochrome b5 heme-binding domain-containing protein n=1 Tax=Capsaspora owczarzaki (strain ATCC 30864) TaxID=595528 RepID=A0A0D2X1T3_CAPO3|nr:hypothetical protein CAOG_02503 [Capsaspora owczarzaki ATCC 30864]KJE91359.1 hypothetical protein CAOG_002503 [Capsaspora owczarzaki ATCC 30864]|eukprot:XP_004349253.1 hypothetical protein CAOG_02503 [Capsaspora owczarzaki ATCC 30864]
MTLDIFKVGQQLVLPAAAAAVCLTWSLTAQPHVPPTFASTTVANSDTVIPATPLATLPIAGRAVEFTLPALHLPTAVLAVALYYVFGFCYTAGYHRLWAHQAFVARLPLRLALALGGAANFVGSALTWSRDHRSHHRHIDTKDDPFNIQAGFFHVYPASLFAATSKIGTADVSDLKADWILMLQHGLYMPLAIAVGWILPAWIAGHYWNDAVGGLFYAGVLRAVLFAHIQRFTDALGHTIGTQPYSSRTSARNNAFLSCVTFGENFLNFHYEFPRDYRMGIRAFHIDLTKWVLKALSLVSLVHSLHTTPLKEALLLRVQRKQEKLDAIKAGVKFGPEPEQLPVMTLAEVKAQTGTGRSLVIMDGLVLDMTEFVTEHPGGTAILTPKVGKDITIAFNGGVQRHSKAARNLAALMRVGRLPELEAASVLRTAKSEGESTEHAKQA